MCGRYYVDEETMIEIENLVISVDERLRAGMYASRPRFQPTDIHPTDIAPVLSADHKKICCKWQCWGFPGYQKKQIIFNARSETVMERPAFRDSILNRRVVVPAAWFYEWNQAREKNTFYLKAQPVLFMAGCYKFMDEKMHFVVLTTVANDSMRAVHHRMPLILEKDEVAEWIFNGNKTEEFLNKCPGPMQRCSDYEQLKLF